MRGLIPGLATPHPIERLLPAMLAGDDFTLRLVSGLDEVLAPVLSDLDSLDAYLDPRTTPADFLDWLASWVGVTLDPDWPDARRRALVANTVELYRWRGTVRGLASHVATALGVDRDAVEIEEGGGVRWSASPGADLPGTGGNAVLVRVRADTAELDQARLEAVVAEAVPAHLEATVEIVGTGGAR